MTPEEAQTNIMAYVIAYCEDIPFQVIEALDTARGALEKQIPKKPVEYSCPSCNESDIEVWQDGGYSATKLDYCPNCGQRIDWTHEEEQE